MKMRLFECQNCHNAVHFDNTVCVNCHDTVGYIQDRFEMTALEPRGAGRWTALADPGPSSPLGSWAAAGAPQPDVSTLNASDGAVTSNMAIVPTTNGTIEVFATDSTNLLLDLSGYFAP